MIKRFSIEPLDYLKSNLPIIQSIKNEGKEKNRINYNRG